ncbi:MAG: Gfo/Idh/MocA family oxidoreductase [Planctomycetaceae bacterium]|nr:Gfo/Idh/MocA family oxidoreductase [Planctomycetaceae bacterium]MCB9951620.1 Gfo/Idh/MocA family oxidoreductase [Planctomycetaceae bacterium]
MSKSPARRTFLKQVSLAAAASALMPTWDTSTRTMADDTKSPNERPRVGCIGNGGMGRGDGNSAKRYGDIVANCDVDREHAAKFQQEIAEGKSEIYGDYRKILERDDLDVVTISTPDHWHTQIAITALRSGKDVYCQKPLTLTIAEGKLLRDVVKETGRVLQVGTQQRSEFGNMFLKAVAMCRGGRIGTIKRAVVAIGGAPNGGPFAKSEAPSVLNWDMWLGQAPKVDYITERCHGNFRWWYEYSGGKLTDWGAHHVDIAQWAIGMEESGPTEVNVEAVTHPQELLNGMPTKDDFYNTAVTFQLVCKFPNGVEMIIRDNAEDLGFDNGILFEGTEGRFFVNRGKLTGGPVDALREKPLEESELIALRKGKRLDSHMGNFIECARDGGLPVSDVFTHHRALTTCHLANIALRLGRNLQWNPETEQIVGDEIANKWQAREHRSGFEVG